MIETSKSITTAEVELAVIDYLGWRRNIVVPNLSHSMLPYEADVVSLTSSGYGTEVEIKVSKADLLADFKKVHQHDHELFRCFYYAVPLWLKDFALEHISDRAGLILVGKNRYQGDLLWAWRHRNARVNPKHRKWKDTERLYLARLGAMRIYGLKKSLLDSRSET